MYDNAVICSNFDQQKYVKNKLRPVYSIFIRTTQYNNAFLDKNYSESYTN